MIITFYTTEVQFRLGLLDSAGGYNQLFIPQRSNSDPFIWLHRKTFFTFYTTEVQFRLMQLVLCKAGVPVFLYHRGPIPIIRPNSLLALPFGFLYHRGPIPIWTKKYYKGGAAELFIPQRSNSDRRVRKNEAPFILLFIPQRSNSDYEQRNKVQGLGSLFIPQRSNSDMSSSSAHSSPLTTFYTTEVQFRCIEQNSAHCRVKAFYTTEVQFRSGQRSTTKVAQLNFLYHRGPIPITILNLPCANQTNFLYHRGPIPMKKLIRVSEVEHTFYTTEVQFR